VLDKNLGKPGTGSNSHFLFRDLLKDVLVFFPDVLQSLPLLEILEDHMAQALPWLTDGIIWEYLAFEAAFDTRFVDKLKFVLTTGISGTVATYKLATEKGIPPDPSLAGYAFWSLLVQLDARPVMRCLVRPLAKSYYAAIVEQGNPNGLVACICGEQNTVNSQIEEFVNTKNKYGWRFYAYNKNYYEWLEVDVGTMDERSSRLDYFVLRGLTQREVPGDLPISINNLQLFKGAIEEHIKKLVQIAVNEFKNSGKYFIMWVDAAGAQVQDLVDSSAGFIRNIWRAGQQTSSTLHALSGIVEQWRWSEQGFTGYTKWAKAPIDGLTPFYNILEHKVRELSGGLRAWRLGENQTLLEFSQYATSAIDGAVDAVNKVLQQTRDIEGRLQQWVYSDGELRAHLIWAASGLLGGAVATDCVMHTLRDVRGQLKKWEYEVGNVFKTFNHWAISNSLGNPDPTALLQVSCDLRLYHVEWY
jgi:hypothetical protein